MTMVSKYPLEQKISDRVYEIFLQVIANLKTSESVDAFLEEFLTPTEKIMLAKRLSIAVLLGKGYDHESICQTLKVSSGTITKVNYWIRHSKGVLSKIVEDILKEEKSDEIWKNINDTLEKVMLPTKGSNWSLKRKALEENKRRKEKPF